jgi:hypothetical protein
VAVIPGGMTPLLQPADVFWNKPFKTLMKEKWLEWLNKGEEEYTSIGKRKSASYEVITQWVSDCWKSISEDLIKQLFTGCRICDTPNPLNSRLQYILENGLENYNQQEDHTGLTDDEEDSEEEGGEEED